MKSRLLIFFTLSAPFATPKVFAQQTTLPALPPTITDKVLAQDTNGPYTLQVVRAA